MTDDARSDSPQGPDMAIRKPVVLVVDDDDFQLKIVELVLGVERYDLHFLSDAVQALAWLGSRRADLVMVDVQMPGLDGLAMTRRLKAAPELAHIPVLLMSGQGENVMVLQCLDAGAQDFVVKPFERASLQAKVAQLLAMPVAAASGGVELPHPGINVARGLSVWGRLEDYNLFLRKFARTYADSIARLRDYYAQQDADGARALAHKLRGAAGTMSLDDIAYCAGALEMLAPEQDPMPSLLQLQRAMEVAMASIAAFAGTAAD